MENKKTNFIKKVSIIPSLIIMLIIFTLSSFSGDESSVQSGLTRDFIMEGGRFLFGFAVLVSEHAVRKSAHMIEYAALGCSVVFPLYLHGSKGPGLLRKALFICMLYAASDEFHQLFVPGRSSQVSDVVIDTFGSFIGIVICLLILRKNNYTQSRKTFHIGENRY